VSDRDPDKGFLLMKIGTCFSLEFFEAEGLEDYPDIDEAFCMDVCSVLIFSTLLSY